jgi:hypothetical protein
MPRAAIAILAGKRYARRNPVDEPRQRPTDRAERPGSAATLAEPTADELINSAEVDRTGNDEGDGSGTVRGSCSSDRPRMQGGAMIAFNSEPAGSEYCGAGDQR